MGCIVGKTISVEDLESEGFKGMLTEGAKHILGWKSSHYLYACAKIGAVAVTVNTNYKQAELEYLCENSDMHTLCIVDGEKDSNFL